MTKVLDQSGDVTEITVFGENVRVEMKLPSSGEQVGMFYTPAQARELIAALEAAIEEVEK